MAPDSHDQINLHFFSGAKAAFSLGGLPPEMIRLKQVHGSVGYRMDSHSDERQEGDWLWTTKSALRIGVGVADCTAILLSGQCASGEKFVAAIHAGWRGTAAGIIERAIKDIQPTYFSVWLSPSICQSHFEVGDDVIEALGVESKIFCKAGLPHKYFLDLKGFQIKTLKALGAQIFSSSLCTHCQPELFSYRQSGPILKDRHYAWIQL